MAPLVLIFFFLMVAFGGIAIDVMRFETKRVAVQNTLDRASLAAANLKNSLDPVAVVHDHFAKAGISESLTDVRLEEGLNYRIVTAKAEAVSRNLFMKMFDISTLEAVNNSRAEQRISNVEISLVLDVSGSMYNTQTRIRNLKVAAKAFIDSVLANDNASKISLSIVPYNGQVNLGPELMSQFNVSHPHSYPNSYCLDLPSNTWNSTTLSLTSPLPQVPFADTFSSDTSPAYNSTRKLYSNVWCNPVAANFVSVHQSDPIKLKAKIDALVPIGGTSIDVGLKWGLVLLDPSARPIINNLNKLATSNTARISDQFKNRPAEYGDPENMKVLIIMTDGENFAFERVNDNYRSGPSNIFVYDKFDRDNFSVFLPERLNQSSTRCTPYYSRKEKKYYGRPYAGSTPSTQHCYSASDTLPNKVREVTWQDLYTSYTVQWIANNLLAPADNSNRNNKETYWLNQMRSQTSIATMDAQTQSLCQSAKRQDIVIYSIAFEATNAGKKAMRNCATWPETTYYREVATDGSGINLTTAFEAIASHLSQLRLTQ